jgi:hypothetical protein
MSMKAFTVSAVFLVALCALSLHPASAADVNDMAGPPLSVLELKTRVIAPRFFKVVAYVIEKYDTCPPCPPEALCETCQLGIYVADDNRPPETGVSMDYGIYLQTDRAKEFQVGSRYLFRIRYRMEKSPAGPWRQTGPELAGFTLIAPDHKSE